MGTHLKKHCESIGFKIISEYNGEKEADWCASWLELQRPGELTSLRGGQNLAEIKQIINLEIKNERLLIRLS